MLLSLHIENLAVIKKIDIDFSEGFNAITGETGAGKSVILEGLGLLLGKKAERELIRFGEQSAYVSALFKGVSPESESVLSECGISSDDGEIMISRSISKDGKSTVKINGRAVSISVLKLLAPTLMVIHGQSDTASLQDSKKQLELIDLYSSDRELLEEYEESYKTLAELRGKIRDITEKESERERLVEILEYQIKDIESASLTENEEDLLIEKKLKIKNSEKIAKNAGFAFKALRGSEKGSVAFLLDKSATALAQISGVIPEFEAHSEKLRDILYQIEDIAEDVYSAVEDIEDAPDEKLNEIESRLDKISKLKRKYGLTVKDILDFKTKSEAELEALKNSESVLKELSKQESEAYLKAAELADKLHEIRTNSAKEIEAKVKETLEFLDMPKVVFYTEIKEEFDGGRKILYPDGSDTLEFYISANRGADAQPLSKVASGGELARVMLALKSVISDKDGVSSVVFDEIDAGVSGKTARKIGIKMLNLSQKTQIFSVTHSAQIASLADAHYLISKGDVNGATETKVTLLSEEGRIKELSRILGGISVTGSQRAAAEDMLSERAQYINN